METGETNLSTRSENKSKRDRIVDKQNIDKRREWWIPVYFFMFYFVKGSRYVVVEIQLSTNSRIVFLEKFTERTVVMGLYGIRRDIILQGFYYTTRWRGINRCSLQRSFANTPGVRHVRVYLRECERQVTLCSRENSLSRRLIRF